MSMVTLFNEFGDYFIARREQQRQQRRQGLFVEGAEAAAAMAPIKGKEADVSIFFL
jgi:hypothetical protein